MYVGLLKISIFIRPLLNLATDRSKLIFVIRQKQTKEFSYFIYIIIDFSRIISIFFLKIIINNSEIKKPNITHKISRKIIIIFLLINKKNNFTYHRII